MISPTSENGPAACKAAAGSVRVESVSAASGDECRAKLLVHGVDVRHNQMSHGQFSAAIVAASISADLSLILTSYGTSVASHGTAPATKYMLCLPVSSPAGVYLDHRRLDSNTIGVLRPNQEFHSYRPARFRLLSVLADAAALEQRCEAMFDRPLAKVVGGAQGFEATDGEIAACTRHFAEICDEAVIDPRPLASLIKFCGGAQRLADEMIDDVLAMVTPQPPVRGWSARQRLVGKAWEVVEDDEAGVVTVSQLCRRLEVPIRTLDDAFHACFGITPKRFITGVRLNKVRRRLCQPAEDTTVTGAATALSFFHFGHFGRQYRDLFGEPPSHTLARARGDYS